MARTSQAAEQGDLDLLLSFLLPAFLSCSWGRNQNGQLGIGTTEDALVPTEISSLKVCVPCCCCALCCLCMRPPVRPL